MKKLSLSIVTMAIIVGIACGGRTATFTVTPSSDNNCSDFDCDLQSALNAASSNDEGDTINIASGTYDASNVPFVWNTTKNFPLTIVGTGATIIDGGNTSLALYIDTSNVGDDENAHIALNNISFQNGSQPLTQGGGVFIRTNNANVTVDGCSFIGNTAQDGGGLYLISNGGAILIKTSIFTANSASNFAGGGCYVYSNTGSITAERNIFLGNSSNCQAGGIYANTWTGNIILSNSIFVTNSANCGGGGALLVNGVLENTPGVITAVNNTFTSNSAYAGGGGIGIALDNAGSRVNLYNNIVWNNIAIHNANGNDIYVCDDCTGFTPGGEVNLYNNNFSGFYSSCQQNAACTPTINQANNINNDPLFANISDPEPENWDLHLTPDSPSINAGDNNAPNLPLSDIEGNPRISGPAPDMGAYELLSVNPAQGTIGTEIVISGSGYGTKKGKVLLGSLALKILSWSEDSILAKLLKPLSPGIYNVTIRPQIKGSSPITIPNGFTVEAPEIDFVEPTSGSTGDEITIYGSFFGTKKGKVTPGEKSCKIRSWTMDKTTGVSEIRFVVPKRLEPGTYELKVTTTKVGSDTVDFTVE